MRTLISEIHSTKRGNFDAALARYREALAINPDLAEGHNNLGATLKELGQAGCRRRQLP